MKTIAEASRVWRDITALPSIQQALWQSEDAAPKPIDSLRSVVWKLLLLNPSFSEAPKADAALSLQPVLQAARAHYTTLHNQLLSPVSPQDDSSSLALQDDDPLNDSSKLWTTLRADETLRSDIALDVERCMPEMTYFRDPEVQRAMVDGLFVWCKNNEHVGYRQGMHELIGFCVWVVESDSVDLSKEKDKTAEKPDVVLKEILDRRFMEHDVYALFEAIMSTGSSFFEPAIQVAGSLGQDTDSKMIIRAKRIFYELLPQIDPELATHLQKIDVIPQIFLMRWVRLLFGREFPFQDVLEIWDLLFSSGPDLELVDFVCISMILRLRWELLKSDTNNALTLLLRYPPLTNNSSPRSLLFDARTLHSSTNVETGAAVIHTRTGQNPAPVEPSSLTRRPRSPFSYSTSSPASLEALLSSAAKDVLARGEKWGVNQAVRDVVGEMRKNVLKNVPRGITSPGSPVGRGRGRGNRTESHGTIAANLLRRMNVLEDRNQRLAAMMEESVGDLWSVHEWLVEQQKDRGSQPQKKESQDYDRESKEVERMSTAVAKIQFIQAFLKDLNLPLPEDLEESKAPEVPEKSPDTTQPNVNEKSTKSTNPEVKSESNISSPPVTSTIDIKAPTPAKNIPQINLQHTQESASLPKHLSHPPSSQAPSTTIPPLSSSPSLYPRPRLTESSFSWMLTGDAQGSSFSRATPFAPHEKRREQATSGSSSGQDSRKGKGFLFGDDGALDDIQETRRGSDSSKRGKRKGGESGMVTEGIDLGAVGEDG